jgi:hypothetical protein
MLQAIESDFEKLVLPYHTEAFVAFVTAGLRSRRPCSRTIPNVGGPPEDVDFALICPQADTVLERSQGNLRDEAVVVGEQHVAMVVSVHSWKSNEMSSTLSSSTTVPRCVSHLAHSNKL